MAQVVKNLPAVQETQVQILGQEAPLEDWKWQPTPLFLPGESQEWGSLVDCHLWGHTQSDMTEVT